MSEISIRRRHGQTQAAARASAERLARELQQEFDLAYEWDDDCLRFTRSASPAICASTPRKPSSTSVSASCSRR